MELNNEKAVVIKRQEEELENGVMKVANGEFSYVASAVSHDEIGRTIVAFNRMVDVLRSSHEISTIKNKLSEAHRIARLGYIEMNSATGVWTIGDGAHDMLGLSPSVSSGMMDSVFCNVISDDYERLRDIVGRFDFNNLDIEMKVDGKILHALGQSTETTLEENTFVVTLQDVTQQRAAERERTVLIERLSEASRLESLGTLAGGVAHEINTPAQYIGDNLSFIKDLLPRLLDVATEARAAATTGDWTRVAAAAAAFNYDFAVQELPVAADQALAGIERISTIVTAIKAFSYPSGKTPMPFDINRAIEMAATVTSSQWKYVATLDLRLDHDLPALNAIEGEINQVLINLIVNAAQAIGEAENRDPGRIDIATRLVDRDIEVSVADTGVGISAENQGRLFEMFFTTKPPGQGTGQGLAITRAIILRHGGSIRVESKPGAGACFLVRLPVDGPPPELREVPA